MDSIQKIPNPPQPSKDNKYFPAKWGYTVVEEAEISPWEVNEPTINTYKGLMKAQENLLNTWKKNGWGDGGFKTVVESYKAQIDNFSYKIKRYQEWLLKDVITIRPGQTQQIEVTYTRGSESTHAQSFAVEIGLEVSAGFNIFGAEMSAKLASKFNYSSSNQFTISQSTQRKITDTQTNPSTEMWYFYYWQLVQGFKLKRFYKGEPNGSLSYVEEMLEPPLVYILKDKGIVVEHR